MLSRAGTLFTALLALASLLGASENSPVSPVATTATAPRWRVLFVGNSLTAVNDVPATVARLARADFAGEPALAYGSILVGGASLDDQLQRGELDRALAGLPWHAVVLQQGPSTLAESRSQLVASTRRIAMLTVPREIPVALYSPWPEERRRALLGAVSDSYRVAAKAVGGALLPAGDAWGAAWRADRRLALYGPDRFHPSPLGSYLAALVIYGGLTGRPLAGLTARLGVEAPGDLPDRPDLRRLFEEAAASALAARPVEVAGALLRP
jgi:hypothetical protein